MRAGRFSLILALGVAACGAPAGPAAASAETGGAAIAPVIDADRLAVPPGFARGVEPALDEFVEGTRGDRRGASVAAELAVSIARRDVSGRATVERAWVGKGRRRGRPGAAPWRATARRGDGTPGS